MDGVVRHDCTRGHVGLADTANTQTCNHLVGRSDVAQRCVDADVFWAAPVVARRRSHRSGLGLHRWVHRHNAPRTTSRGPIVCAVSCVGELCERVECQHRIDELVHFIHLLLMLRQSPVKACRIIVLLIK